MNQPLAERLRPSSLDEMVGQEHLLGPKGLIAASLKSKHPLSILLFGPPGCGKTTLALAYAKAFEAKVITLSAVSSGIADLKKIVETLQNQPLFGRSVVIFIDEIHRYNKAQQDFLLPYIEKGIFTLIGATTENPSFSLNSALLSRLRVLTLKALDEEQLYQLIERYEKAGGKVQLETSAKEWLTHLAHGDGRALLNLLENLEAVKSEGVLTLEEAQQVVQKRAALFDKNGELHYQLISALHKAVRGSDPEAALYWLVRMLQGGEDPLFLARRLIRMATEDIGLADPEALHITLAAKQVYESLGSPEGELALAEAVVYLALSPKSNAIYTAYGQMKKLAEETGHLLPPKTIVNAPTKWMKSEGFSKGYLYDHDLEHAFSGQNYFPDGVGRTAFYQPKERGFERQMLKRIEYFNQLRERLQESEASHAFPDHPE